MNLSVPLVFKASFFVFAFFYKKDGISNIVKTIIIR